MTRKNWLGKKIVEVKKNFFWCFFFWWFLKTKCWNFSVDNFWDEESDDVEEEEEKSVEFDIDEEDFMDHKGEHKKHFFLSRF